MLGVDSFMKPLCSYFSGFTFSHKACPRTYQAFRRQGAQWMDPAFQTLGCRGHMARTEWLAISLEYVLSFGLLTPFYKRGWVESFGWCHPMNFPSLYTERDKERKQE